MKSKFLLIIFAFIGFTMLMPQSAISQKKYYIIFDNFEDQKNGDGTTITNLFDLCYWEPLRDDPILGKYAERKPFNSATFLARDITEYDVAIFVMGSQNHLGTSVDGIKVLDKIKQMLAANKSVVIIGHGIIPGAFGTGGDAASKTWLQSYMGVQNPKYINHIISNTIYGFRVDGVEGNPVSAGFKKQCNRLYEENGAGLQGPMRWYSISPVFEVKNGKNAKPFDYVKEIADQDITDELITGVATEDNKARCIFYSINFDIVSGTHNIHFRNSLTRGIRWAVRDIPSPEGFLAAENETIDFAIVEPKQTGYQLAILQNNGREKVKINSIAIAGDEPEGTFKILEGGNPIELGPGDIHQINLSFSPTEERLYEEYLTIKSDATNSTIELKLMGQGGEQVFNGPKLSLQSLPVNFGTVPFGQYVEKNIPITNAGNVSLIVETITLADDGGKRFSFPEIVKTPITIPPGQTVNIKLRFTSSDETPADYSGRIDVTSNGLNNMGKGSISFNARAAGKNTNSGIKLSTTSIDFGKVDIQKPSLFILKISNSGSNDLRIFGVSWDKASGGENLAQFTFVEGTDKNIPTLKPGESHDLKIEFHPESEKEYAAKFWLTTNDPINEGLVDVPVYGIGYDPTSVDDGIASVNGLSFKITPNPISELSVIEMKVDLPANINVDILDVTGRKLNNIMNSYKNQGTYSINFDAKSLPNGIYFVSVNYNGKLINLPFVVTK